MIRDPKVKDKPCVRCETALRDLIDARHCPTCGLAVWLSHNPNDGLDISNPLWLRRMWMACAAMAGALAIIAVALFGGMLVPAAGKTIPGVGIAVAACSLVFHAGLWGLCANERRHPDRMRNLRTLGRIAAVLGAVTSIAWAVGAVAVPGAPVSAGERIQDSAALRAEGFRWLLSTGRFAVFGMSGLSACLWVRTLARRASTPVLARACDWMILVPVLAVFFAGCLLGPSVGNVLRTIGPVVYLPAAAGVLVWAAWIMRRAERESGPMWKAETAT